MANQLSFDLRFVLSLNGKILDYNNNATEFIDCNGDLFFDHFTPIYQKKAFMYIKKIAQSPNAIEEILHQKINGNIEPVHYRGYLHEEVIILVGQKRDQGLLNDNLYRNFQMDMLEPIFSALNVAVLTLNKYNRIIYSNDVFEKQGIVFGGDLDNQLSDPMVSVLKQMAEEIRHLGGNAQRFHIYGKTLYHVQGLYNGDSDVITFIIDDRARSDEFDSLLQHKQQMESVSHLAAGFAHELRNPLSVIRGFIQLSCLTGNINKYYHTMLSEIDRMNDIIDEFLSLSRKTPKRDYYQPFEFFQSLISLVRSECLLRNIRLKYRFERSERVLRLNKSLIKQIILNLLRNSVEAFDEDQKNKCFSITGILSDGKYKVTVADNGPGMEKEVLEKLGKPFFTTKENGTGIGLPLCKKIVHEHDGEFEIESAPGNGTTIEFSFPLIDREGKTISPVEQDMESAVNHNNF